MSTNEINACTNNWPYFWPPIPPLKIACLQPHPNVFFKAAVEGMSTNKMNTCTNVYQQNTNDWPYFRPSSTTNDWHYFQSPLLHEQSLRVPSPTQVFLKIGMEWFVRKRNDCVHKQNTNDGYHFHPPPNAIWTVLGICSLKKRLFLPYFRTNLIYEVEI